MTFFTSENSARNDLKQHFFILRKVWLCHGERHWESDVGWLDVVNIFKQAGAELGQAQPQLC